MPAAPLGLLSADPEDEPDLVEPVPKLEPRDLVLEPPVVRG